MTMALTDTDVTITEDESTHQLLRRKTLEQHRDLDRGLAYLLSARLSPERYSDLLAALFGFYVPLEHSLESWAAASPPLGLALHRRADLLRRDLRAFERNAELCPISAELPALTSLDHVAGVIYVVEGASLGGQVIARQLRQRLGVGPDNGAAFFTGDGAGTAARWTQVLAWLEDQGRDRRRRESMAAAASETFGALSSWLVRQAVLDA